MASIDLDMSQFHEIFFEESSEGIEAMEKGLLGLNTDSPDPEIINTVFRAAHSIKGAAATFGFKDISEFTHTVESILDEVRDRKREVTQELVDTLLKSVDFLGYLVDCVKKGNKPDLKKKDTLLESLNNLPRELPTGNVPKWKIDFKPHPTLMLTGNDPFRLFRELGKLGKLSVKVYLNNLPSIDQIDPEQVYLSWEIIIGSNVQKQEIIDVFEWVLDECELDISMSGERRRLVDRRQEREETPTELTSATAESASIRVNINKIDNLINLVGEMVITQSMLNRYTADYSAENQHRLRDVVKEFENNTRDLQEQAMRIRMLPIDFTFQRLPRIVHDLSREQNKKIHLNISGNTTEVDKTVLEKLSDPLTHLIRNAIDHGIESTEERIEAGKPEEGKITINAFQEGGKIIIRISDDGAGLNLGKILNKALEKGIIKDTDELSEGQIQNLIFQPGFSTATKVTDISGRGVGMDVVKRNINDLGGSVEVNSEAGKGSTFTIKLPLTLAIIDGQLIRVGGQTMILPMLSIIESVQVKNNSIRKLAGEREVFNFRNEYIPVIRLKETFAISNDGGRTEGILVLVDSGHQRVGLFVDDVLDQQQIVIKSLETNYQMIDGISGATVLGDGTVAMIIDIAGLIEMQGITESVFDATKQH